MTNITGSKVDFPLAAMQAETLEEMDEAISAENERREIATILAALRFYQRHCLCGSANAANFVETEIATDGGTLEKMTAAEVDELCERINTKPS